MCLFLQAKYLFRDKVKLAQHIINKLEETDYDGELTYPDPIKLQQIMYFLYGYYSARFDLNNFDRDIVIKQSWESQIPPEELFSYRFKAGYYGATDFLIDSKYVYKDNGTPYYEKPDTISDEELYLSSSIRDRDFYNYMYKMAIDNPLNDLIGAGTNTFTLVKFTHNTKAWKEAYAKNDNGTELIHKETLKEEFKQRLFDN